MTPDGACEDLLLVAACNFGWGSVGKLRLVLDELDGVRAIMYGQQDWVGVTQRLLSPAHRLETYSSDAIPNTPNTALVVNDPAAADAIAELGSAVVYVDSLPYLWATADEVPKKVAAYCAQRSPVGMLPSESPLATRSDIFWIDPITPRPQARTGGEGIVLNVGGLHSHLSEGADEAYLALVVAPLVRALVQDGYRILAVCGNISPLLSAELAQDVNVPVGPQTVYQFEDMLKRADILITSPGSTTLLQAAALQLPTVMLPPQNLSQILNAEIFALPDTHVVSWPTSVLDRSKVDRLRPLGEDEVLKYIYGAIYEAAQSTAKRAEVTASLNAAVKTAPMVRSTLAWNPGLGMSGATAVADVVREQLSYSNGRQ